jgi:hypothetical protein
MARLLLLSLTVLLAACATQDDPEAVEAFLSRHWKVTSFESDDLGEILGDTYEVLQEANLNMSYDLSLADSAQSFYGASQVSSGTWQVGPDGKTLTLGLENEPEPLVLTIVERGADRVVFSWQRGVPAAGGASQEAAGTMTWEVLEQEEL